MLTWIENPEVRAKVAQKIEEIAPRLGKKDKNQLVFEFCDYIDHREMSSKQGEVRSVVSYLYMTDRLSGHAFEQMFNYITDIYLYRTDY